MSGRTRTRAPCAAQPEPVRDAALEQAEELAALDASLVAEGCRIRVNASDDPR